MRDVVFTDLMAMQHGLLQVGTKVKFTDGNETGTIIGYKDIYSETNSKAPDASNFAYDVETSEGLLACWNQNYVEEIEE